LLGTNAGVDFVFFTLFLALLNVLGCEVGSLASVATLPELL
jgi:hypothetical protein